MKIKSLLLITMFSLGCSSIFAQNMNALDSASYSFGMLVAQNLKSQGFTEINAAMLAQGVDDVINGRATKFNTQDAQRAFENFSRTQKMKGSEKTIEEGKKYLATNGAKAGVTTLPSGLQYEVMTKGTGTAHPTATDKVKVHYHGTNIDGSVFDSSVNRGEPISFPLNGVIAGWTEGVQKMVIGDKFRFTIPANLAYGERGAGANIKPFSVLVFEVELLGINVE